MLSLSGCERGRNVGAVPAIGGGIKQIKAKTVTFGATFFWSFALWSETVRPNPLVGREHSPGATAIPRNAEPVTPLRQMIEAGFSSATRMDPG
jgi:hypothetical protein